MTLGAHDITVRRGGTDILAGVSATLEPGTITAICGPNGAGKSTLLSCLAGLLTPDAGRVALDGHPLADFPPRERARAIGYLPQSGEVAWDVAVRTLVALGRMPHDDADPAPVDRALDALDLRPFADRPLSRLSGGERARALLARVLAGGPRWILADEPLAALDIAHQLTLIRRLRMTADAGTGVVLVVHDLALAMNHADRVLVLGDGKLASDGPPRRALGEEVITIVWGVHARWSEAHGTCSLHVE